MLFQLAAVLFVIQPCSSQVHVALTRFHHCLVSASAAFVLPAGALPGSRAREGKMGRMGEGEGGARGKAVRDPGHSGEPE